MALSLGAGQITSLESYCGIGKETTWGTYATATSQLIFESAALTKKRNSQIVEEIVRNSSRTYGCRVNLGVMVDGDIGFNYRATDDSNVLILAQAFGGAIASATVSSGVSYLHTIDIGDMVNNTNSASAAHEGLSINMRKGGTDGKVFEYHGCRVNELMFTAEIDDLLKCTASFIGKDSTQNSNDISSVMTNTSTCPIVFTGGRVSIEDSVGAIATTPAWHVQSIEWGIANSLKADAESREIGSETVQVLPPGVANITLNMSMRFDTVTAYQAMIAGSQYAAEIEFQGNTISGSDQKQYLKFTFPKIYLAEGAEPEVGGPDEILKTDLVFHVLADSQSGYSVQAEVRNGTENY